MQEHNIDSYLISTSHFDLSFVSSVLRRAFFFFSFQLYWVNNTPICLSETAARVQYVVAVIVCIFNL